MRTRTVPLLALLATAIFLTISSSAYAQRPESLTPTLENLSTGLTEMISHLRLTHTQHEQVERIIANEAEQLWLIRENSNLSVAGVFTQEHAIRIQARRRIASILTPKQVEKIAKLMIHDMKERQRWGHDPTSFFSIPSTY